MLMWFARIDALLRGDLRKNQHDSEGAIDFPIIQVLVVSIALAAIFGASIGSFAAVSARVPRDGWMQLLATHVSTQVASIISPIQRR